ncbi:MAG: SDR family oxidoreductase [Anaerolineae bacterium]|nr:SDR family oxidoreductase [Anaerolineae bacterium]
MELKDQVVLITGGGTGLGRTIALAMADEGAHLAIGYSKSEADALATAKELQGRGARAMAVQADVASSAEVVAMVAAVMQAYGRIDVLINNAGFTVFVPFDDLDGMEEADWDRLMAVNAKGPFLCCKAVVPIMRAQGAGRIVNIGTISGIRPMGSSLGYSVSKAALAHFTKCLARGVAPAITVNMISPGSMLTRWVPNRTEESIRNTIEAAPLKRFSELEDVAAAVLMVARNDSMTGQVVVVDAGVSLVA